MAANPDAPALIDGPRRWSYRELSERAVALAAALATRGVGKGDVVGLLLPHGAEYCVSLLTCMGIGAPACLLEKNWPRGLLAQFLESADVSIVVTVPELVDLLPPERLVKGATLVLGTEKERAAGEHEAVFPEIDPSDIALISISPPRESPSGT